MKKYVLIEEYEEEEQRGSYYTDYAVRSFPTEDKLIDAYLKGPQHDGKLYAGKLLEVKVGVKE
ncbi:MAG: hypothetical protein ACE5J7_04005 [Candidatus Aenigmatarchaeota archaeon]